MKKHSSAGAAGLAQRTSPPGTRRRVRPVSISSDVADFRNLTAATPAVPGRRRRRRRAWGIGALLILDWIATKARYLLTFSDPDPP